MPLPPTRFTDEIRLILDQCGIKAPPVDLTKVSTYLGLIYEERCSPEEFEAKIRSYGGRAYAIVNTNQTETHRRFTLAYLLYYYTHQRSTSRPEVRVRPRFPKLDSTYYRQNPLSPVTASLFSVELLVPHFMLEEFFDASNHALDVPLNFRVSPEVAKFAISYYLVSSL